MNQKALEAAIDMNNKLFEQRKEIDELRRRLHAANVVGIAKTREATALKNALTAALDMLAKWSLSGGPLDPSHHGLTNEQQQEFDWLWTKIDNLVGDHGEYTETSDE